MCVFQCLWVISIATFQIHEFQHSIWWNDDPFFYILGRDGYVGVTTLTCFSNKLRSLYVYNKIFCISLLFSRTIIHTISSHWSHAIWEFTWLLAGEMHYHLQQDYILMHTSTNLVHVFSHVFTHLRWDEQYKTRCFLWGPSLHSSYFSALLFILHWHVITSWICVIGKMLEHFYSSWNGSDYVASHGYICIRPLLLWS